MKIDVHGNNLIIALSVLNLRMKIGLIPLELERNKYFLKKKTSYQVKKWQTYKNVIEYK